MKYIWKIGGAAILFGLVLCILYGRSIELAYGEECVTEEWEDEWEVGEYMQSTDFSNMERKILYIKGKQPEKEVFEELIEKLSGTPMNDKWKKSYKNGGYYYGDTDNGVIINMWDLPGSWSYLNTNVEEGTVIEDNSVELSLKIQGYLKSLGCKVEEKGNVQADNEDFPTKYTFTYRGMVDDVPMEDGMYQINGLDVADTIYKVEYTSEGVASIHAFGYSVESETEYQMPEDAWEQAQNAGREWIRELDCTEDWKRYYLEKAEMGYLPSFRMEGLTRKLALMPAIRMDVKVLSYDYETDTCDSESRTFVYNMVGKTLISM